MNEDQASPSYGTPGGRWIGDIPRNYYRGSTMSINNKESKANRKLIGMQICTILTLTVSIILVILLALTLFFRESPESLHEVKDFFFQSDEDSVKLGKAEKLLDSNEPYESYSLRNDQGFVISLCSLGASIASIEFPGHFDVALNPLKCQWYYDKYNRSKYYFGATVGRYANRIANGQFSIDGRSYKLPLNNGRHHLHGGFLGFDRKHWHSQMQDDNSSVVFTLLSRDGDEGYPGNLVVSAKYSLTQEGALRISYRAMTTKATPVNIANHVYFNLGGHESGPDSLYNHTVTINANRYTPVDDELIPTGEIKNVEGTPFDLREAKRLGDVINKVQSSDPEHPGFDHNFVVSQDPTEHLNFVARAEHTPSGRFVEVYSNQPGVQFYTGNFFPLFEDREMLKRYGFSYVQHGGLCLETQLYPDSVNRPEFGLDPILRPGEVYKHDVVYQFGIAK